MFLSLLTNGKKVAIKKLEGRDHFVVPVAMIAEGVWKGNEDKFLYTKEVLTHNMSGWDHKPVVVYHPTEKGKAISACDPKVLNNSKIGVILNTKYSDDKLRCEAWIDCERVKSVDERVYDAIVNEKTMEVSTGMSASVDLLELQNNQEAPAWNGKEYHGVVSNIVPDHLAILPDMVGACSVKDGAGLMVTNAAQEEVQQYLNAISRYTALVGLKKIDVKQIQNLSFDETSSKLNETLRLKFGEPGCWWDGFVVEVYPSSVIFYNGRPLYKMSYKVKDDEIVLVGDPIEVHRKVSYVTDEGTVITNQGNHEMNKAQLIQTLLTNSSTNYTEAERAVLEALPESVLQKMVTNSTTAIKTPTAPVIPTPTTLEALIASAPTHLQNAFKEIEAAHKEQRAGLIAIINANPEVNPFTVEYLETQDTEMLKGLAKLASGGAKIAAQTNVQNARPAIFKGGAGAGTTTLQNAATGAKPLVTEEL